MKKVPLFVMIFFLLTACTQQSVVDGETPECIADSDCAKAGCSGQVCTTTLEAPNIVTTCEYRPEYDCYQASGCGCIKGKCSWDEEVESCVEQKKTTAL